MKLFPAVRLSELRALRNRDRQKLMASQADLKMFFREKTRPVRFLVEHSGTIFGSLGSLIALYGVGSSVLTPLSMKASRGPAGKAVGLVGRLSRVGLGYVIKALTPAFTTLIKKGWNQATERRDSPSRNNPL